MHVVLTFDDAVSNHATAVAPLLRRHGFGATFFICEYPGPGDGTDRFETDKHQYMTWGQIRGLAEAGFELGNHTGTHVVLRNRPDTVVSAEIALIESRFREHGIPHPTAFAYPCGEYDDVALACVRRHGYRLARATGARPWCPTTDDPFAIPSFVITDADPTGVAQALDATAAAIHATGLPHLAVLTFHGVPDYNHPWVTFSPDNFLATLDLLRSRRCTVTALRDVATPAGPSAIRP